MRACLDRWVSECLLDKQPHVCTDRHTMYGCVYVCVVTVLGSPGAVSAGPEEPEEQSCGGGEGRPPSAAPSLLYWHEACDLHPGAGRMEGEGSQEVVLLEGRS